MSPKTAKLIKQAIIVCRNDIPEPSNCPIMPLIMPLISNVRKMSNGILMATKSPCKGARQKPKPKP